MYVQYIESKTTCMIIACYLTLVQRNLSRSAERAETAPVPAYQRKGDYLAFTEFG